ncbi:hypothetical protein ABW19_dt0201732 [Dactylella cylindrospora]|nr:hypothetical protein ABW19_dt0201732 [Dactylella cylindrospora]
MASSTEPTTIVESDNHDPNDILNPSFIDLFIEEAPPEWTMADLQQLTEIRGQPPLRPAPFQQLPVEIIEHIAFELVHFRDIRALANTCGFFRKILFESSNHLFWYKWSKAPHSMCRWDLGYYRKNRAYQNTIVNQQNGKRRKRCEKCMARAVRDMAFKRKTCLDCWEDLGMPANELFFLKQIDVSSIPREYVSDAYAPTGDNHWYRRREWDLLYFFKPALQQQLTDSIYLARDSRPTALLNFAKQFIRDMSSEATQMKKSMSYKYYSYTYYRGSNVRRENWYVDVVDDLISPHEVIQRCLELSISQDAGDKWLYRGKYKPLETPENLYGPSTDFAANFPRTLCDLQVTDEYLKKFGEDPDNIHECDFECQRKKRATKFKEIWWPVAEKRLLDMLIGEGAVDLTDGEIAALKIQGYSWQWRETTQKVVKEMLAGIKWLIPGVNGDYTAESVEKWEAIHGKGKGKAPNPGFNTG